MLRAGAESCTCGELLHQMTERVYNVLSWGEFAAAGAPPIDFILTVCDNAAGEVCGAHQRMG